MAKVVLENLVKTFPEKNGREVRAVNGVSLAVEDRELMVLVGPSGCGKSTTLRMIAGLEEISSGSVSIDGRVVNDVPPKDRDIAMVFQNYALYPHMSVHENMAFGLKLRKLPKPEIEERVREAASLLGLEAYLDRKPKALSGGQRQRVAVGRAIVRKPAVFLFDEPLSNLDAKMRVQMRVELARLHRQLGATMLYVTHDQVEAMTMGERIVVMKDGVAQQADAPLRMYDCPCNRFVAGFIGTPQMNFFDGRIGADGATFEGADGLRLPAPADQKTALAAYAGRAVVLGLRPEEIGSVAAEQQPDAPCIRAVIEAIEPMGSETHVHFRAGATAFVGRLDAHGSFPIGRPAAPAVRMTQAHFFDPQTERRIG